MTRDEVRAEHAEAMASLTPDQVQAFRRISRAFQESRFANRSARETLELVFEEEARERSSDAGGER